MTDRSALWQLLAFGAGVVVTLGVFMALGDTGIEAFAVSVATLGAVAALITVQLAQNANEQAREQLSAHRFEAKLRRLTALFDELDDLVKWLEETVLPVVPADWSSPPGWRDRHRRLFPVAVSAYGYLSHPNAVRGVFQVLQYEMADKHSAQSVTQAAKLARHYVAQDIIAHTGAEELAALVPPDVATVLGIIGYEQIQADEAGDG